MTALDAARLGAYRQCHEYLRSADTRKDVLLIAYSTLTVASVSVAASAQGQSTIWEAYTIWAIALIFLRFLFSLLFTWFRCYHVAYLNQASIIMSDIRQEPRPKGNQQNNFLHWGAEETMFLILVFLVTANIFCALLIGFLWNVWASLGLSGLSAAIGVYAYDRYMGRLDRLKRENRLPDRYLWLVKSLPTPKLEAQPTQST